MTDPKELFRILSADFKAEKDFYFADRGEGMMQGWDRHSDRIFLLDTVSREARELRGADDILKLWDASAIEPRATEGLPDRAAGNAEMMRAAYYFGVEMFEAGTAPVSWMLQPDGCYYADSDGYGIEDDYEVNFRARIDRAGNIVAKFKWL